MSASNESLTYRSALGTTGAGVGQLVKGATGLGLLTLRSGVQVGEAGLAKARAARTEREAKDRRSRRVLIAVVAGVVALVGGAVAFRWLRHRPEPEVAAEPPTLQPSTNGHAPSTNSRVATTAESDRTN